MTSEFAQRVAAISSEINQPVCSYINRRGQVIRVGVGTPHQTQIPPLEIPRYGRERLSGIRCIATQLHQTPPHKSALTAMVLQRLDALAVLTLTGGGAYRTGKGATGYVKSSYLAHLIPDPQNWTLSPEVSLDELTNQDFLDLVENLEHEFQRDTEGKTVDSTQDRVLLVGLKTDRVTPERFSEGLEELRRLVETAGGEVLETVQQRRSQPHPHTVVGPGKVEEIALAAQTLGATLVVFDRDLSPAQVRNLETQTGMRVLDRTEIILDIFAQRAQSRAGKLQVELAQLEYMLPRLTGRGQMMSRLGGGIGTRGPGETKLETERRVIARRLSRLQREVNELQAHRGRLRHQRQYREILAIAIVGYTNAGKSTLLNTLTHAAVYTADQWFATLDATTRRLSVPHPLTGELQTILLTDTVGFIHELPPPLVDAFRATLEEVTEADALLHLVDLSHPAWEAQMQSVTDLLAELAITPCPTLTVFNKIDQVDSDTLALAQEAYPEALFISASDRLGLETLRQKLGQLVYWAAHQG